MGGGVASQQEVPLFGSWFACTIKEHSKIIESSDLPTCKQMEQVDNQEILVSTISKEMTHCKNSKNMKNIIQIIFELKSKIIWLFKCQVICVLGVGELTAEPADVIILDVAEGELA